MLLDVQSAYEAYMSATAAIGGYGMTATALPTRASALAMAAATAGAQASGAVHERV
jgi:hypothetical protein